MRLELGGGGAPQHQQPCNYLTSTTRTANALATIQSANQPSTIVHQSHLRPCFPDIILAWAELFWSTLDIYELPQCAVISH